METAIESKTSASTHLWYSDLALCTGSKKDKARVPHTHSSLYIFPLYLIWYNTVHWVPWLPGPNPEEGSTRGCSAMQHCDRTAAFG
uniref:Uncharacterized protein n=1 Tax=Pyxicephalus adspersus TaxID=30357 RepID=A0AAV2ZXV3_PYXAD|nr:TPA: hypothetical protein GDO54_015379 [Pyxicephalus adspersus]